MSYVGKVTIGSSTHLVGSTLYGTCATAAATAAKVVTCANFDKLETGVTIHVKFTYSNTASNATLNVNSTGAKNLCRYGTTRVGTTIDTSWEAGAVVSFTYDGTSWIMNDYIANTDTPTATVRQDYTSSTKIYPVLLSGEADYYWDDYNTVTSTTYVVPSIKVDPSSGNLITTTINGYALGAACAKNVDTSITAGSTSTNLPTTAAIVSYISSQIPSMTPITNAQIDEICGTSISRASGVSF